jgi:PAS domain S-box-containing protein
MRIRHPFPPEPASVAAARRLVADSLAGLNQESLVDVALLLVSEVVTNAVLHAGTPIDLSLEAENAHVRIEVIDESPQLPSPRGYGEDATTGRGLGLVESLASAYGVERRPVGKVVWFEVREDQQEEPEEVDVDDLLSGWPSLDDETERQAVRLRNAPVLLFRAMLQHNAALQRELALIALDAADGVDGRPLPHLDVDLGASEQLLREALDAGVPSMDLLVHAAAEAETASRTLSHLLAAADQWAHEGRLLTPATLPEVRACREWYLGQIGVQLRGGAPTPWSPLSDVHGPEEPGVAPVEPFRVLEALRDAVIVGDGQNRVSYANAAAEELLGWKREELCGQRLTVLIPERLREQHIAGYTRFLLTGEERLIGTPVRVPALRRDGTEVDVELVLGSLQATGGRPLFAASMRDLSDRATREQDGSLSAAMTAGEAVVTLLGATSSGSATLAGTARGVLQAIGSNLGWHVAGLWIVEEHGGDEPDTVRCHDIWVADPFRADAFIEASLGRAFTRGTGLPGRVWACGAPIWVGDVVADANFPRSAAALRDGLRSAFAFPIRRKGAVTGVIELFTDAVTDPSPDMLALVASIGTKLGALTEPE